MDVLHGDLETIETSGLRDLNFCAELLTKIFGDNAIRSSKKGEDVSDEVFFLCVEFLPVFSVLREIDLVSSPEGGKMLLVHFEDRVVLYGEEDKALRVFGEDGLR